MAASADRSGRARALLPGALAGLVLADVAGGLADVAAGRSRLADAWSSRATLCAPWPMIAAQAVVTGVAVRSTGTPSRVAAGQLARRDLSPTEVGFQLVLLGATGVLGGLATAVAVAK